VLRDIQTRETDLRRYLWKWTRRLACIGLGLFPAAVASLAPRAAAQGCAMCYQSAAATGNHSIVALQHGILILLIPSVGLFVGIFGLIYSRRNVNH
jgi:hypothetical protein